MNRREAFRSLAGGAAVGALAAGSVIMAAPAAFAVEPDPSLAAIDAHKAAWAAWQALKSEADPRADELDRAEQEAWERVTQIVPTTMYGVARLASHVAHQIGRDAMPSEQSIQAALFTVSWGAAQFAKIEGRA